MGIGDKLGALLGRSASKEADMTLSEMMSKLIAQGKDPAMVQEAAKTVTTPEALKAAVDAQTLAPKIDNFNPEVAEPGIEAPGSSLKRKLAIGGGLGAAGAGTYAAMSEREPLPPPVAPKKEESAATPPPAATTSPATQDAQKTLDTLGEKINLGKVKHTSVPDLVDHELDRWAKNEMEWAQKNQPQDFDPAKYDAMRAEAQAWYDKEKGRLDTKELFQGLGRTLALLAAGGAFGKGTGAGLSAPMVEQATRFDMEPERARTAGEMRTKLSDIGEQQASAQRAAEKKQSTWADRLRSALDAKARTGQQALQQKTTQADITSREEIENARLGEKAEEFKQRGMDRAAVKEAQGAEKARALNIKLEDKLRGIDKQFEGILSNLSGIEDLKSSVEKKRALAKAKAALMTYAPDVPKETLDGLDAIFGRGESIEDAQKAILAIRDQQKAQMRRAAGADYGGVAPVVTPPSAPSATSEWRTDPKSGITWEYVNGQATGKRK